MWLPSGENFKAKLLAADGYGSEQEALNVVAWSLLYPELEVKDLKLGSYAGFQTAAPIPESPFARLDIVVSNAASGVLKPAMEMKLKHWRWCMEINAFALALLPQHAAPRMKDGGRIVAMSSLGAYRAIPNYGFVGASKAALESLVRSLAQELGPRGIRVNTVNAGVVDTDALGYFPNREALLAEYAARTPAGPVLTPADVANAIYLLCLPEAAMINGTTLFVDGGFAISG